MYPVIHIGSIAITAFPVILCLSVLSCTLILCYAKIKFSCGISDLKNCAAVVLMCAAIGGKALFALTRLSYFITARVTFVDAVKQLGFVFYGGLLGALFGVYLYTHKTQESMYYYTDTIFVLLPLGQSIGRIGCFLNGCCHGKVADCWCAVSYPVGESYVKVIPVQLFESVGCLILAIVLLSIRFERRGIPTCIYLVSYSVLRFILEFYRGDVIRGAIGAISTSQIISIPILITALFLLFNTRAERKIGEHV